MITFLFSSLNLCSVNLWFLVSQDSLLDFSYFVQSTSFDGLGIYRKYLYCLLRQSIIYWNLSFHVSIVSIFGSIMVSLWSWSSSCIIDISWGVVSLSVSLLMSTMQLELSFPFSYILVKRSCVSFKFHYNCCELYIQRNVIFEDLAWQFDFKILINMCLV